MVGSKLPVVFIINEELTENYIYNSEFKKKKFLTMPTDFEHGKKPKIKIIVLKLQT